MNDEFTHYIIELLAPWGEADARKMFGSYGIFRDNLMFGIVSDSKLYLKVDEVNLIDFKNEELKPFTCQSKGTTVRLSYREAPADALDNSDLLEKWAKSAFAAASRAKKP